MIEFLYPNLLWLNLLILPMIFLLLSQHTKLTSFEKIFSNDVIEKLVVKNSGLSQRIRSILLLVSLLFMILALSRPYQNAGEIKIKSNFINMMVAIDMSKSMFSDDVYPTRFEFAKKKLIDMLSSLKNTKVSVMGFSTQTFLISPLTQDFHSIRFLVDNLSIDSLSLKGTDILNTLQSTQELFESEQGNINNTNKILMLLTDGGDSSDFEDEIKYAKSHNITIYIYNIGTQKGGVIKGRNSKILKDTQGNIVITKINSSIKDLALRSGGAYLEYSLNKNDIKLITENIMSKFEAKEKHTNIIKDKKELFVYPLMIAILLVFIGFFSMPKIKYSEGSII